MPPFPLTIPLSSKVESLRDLYQEISVIASPERGEAISPYPVSGIG